MTTVYQRALGYALPSRTCGMHKRMALSHDMKAAREYDLKVEESLYALPEKRRRKGTDPAQTEK
jgi:hypothetical protein